MSEKTIPPDLQQPTNNLPELRTFKTSSLRPGQLNKNDVVIIIEEETGAYVRAIIVNVFEKNMFEVEVLFAGAIHANKDPVTNENQRLYPHRNQIIDYQPS